MNILFITPYYSPLSFGGIENQVKTFSQEISKTNNVVIIAPSNEKDSIKYENKVKVYRTKIVNPSFKDEPRNRDKLFFESIIKSEKIDIIIANNLHTWISPLTTRSLLKSAKENKVPIFLRIHNYCTPESLEMLKDVSWKKYLCVSKSVAKQITSLGADKKRIRVVKGLIHV